MTDIVDDFSSNGAECDNILQSRGTGICIICGTDFAKPGRSRKSTCSNECNRQRRLRYASAYQQLGRDLRAKIVARFGGRVPSDDDIFAMLQQARKAGIDEIDHERNSP